MNIIATLVLSFSFKGTPIKNNHIYFMIFGEGVQYMIAKKVRGMTVFAALAMSVQ